MGYYVSYDFDSIRIPKANIPACLAAINALHTEENKEANAAGGHCWSGGVLISRSYAWTQDPPAGGFTSLEEAFSAWRFESSEIDGDVYLDGWHGEKLGDEETLFFAIGPFVVDATPEGYQGTIKARGEDGALWRFLFKDGTVTQQEARIEWV